MIRDATVDDAAAIAALYNPYLRHTVITFEIDPVPAEDFGARILRVQEAGLPWLVMEENGEVLGFAYGAQYRPRAAYLHSVETTIYLADGASGAGRGRALYAALIDRLRGTHVHTALALIALPNDASVGLHEALGFRHAGTITQVGRKFDQWIDVGHWQLDLHD
jgi:phosphinothricin acetyltransferase